MLYQGYLVGSCWYLLGQQITINCQFFVATFSCLVKVVNYTFLFKRVYSQNL